MDARAAAYVRDVGDAGDFWLLPLPVFKLFKLLNGQRHPPAAFLWWAGGIFTTGTLKCCGNTELSVKIPAFRWVTWRFTVRESETCWTRRTKGICGCENIPSSDPTWRICPSWQSHLTQTLQTSWMLGTKPGQQWECVMYFYHCYALAL